MHDIRVANLLGASALAVGDLLGDSAATTAGVSRSAASALAVLLQAGDLAVSDLGRRVGLSQPAAARMVDSLQHAGHVDRRRGPGREVYVVLTDRGADAARAVLRGRSERLAGLLDGFSAAERRSLADLHAKILTNIYRGAPDANLICRLCDRAGCVSTGERCPVGQAAGEPPDV